MVDVWRHLHPHSSSFTWQRPDGSFSSRINLVGCPLPWLHHVKACDIIPCPYSDHAAVLLVCPIPVPKPRGPGRWKFNASLLKDAAFVKEVENFWAYWTLRKPSSPLQSWWDKGKKRLKSIAIGFGTTCKAQHSDSRSLLSSLTSHLNEQIDNGRVSLYGP